MRLRERPPLRLNATITTVDGHAARWGLDEPSPENVPNDLSFSTTMPGGFEQASCSLPRKPGIDYSDLVPFSTITIYGAGGQIAWQGRLETAPRTSGDHYAVTPGAVGWQAHLDDDPTARFIFVDIDQTHWQGASNQRRLDLHASSIDYEDPAGSITDVSTASPILQLQLTSPWARAHLCEAWYNANGIPIGQMYFAWKRGTGTGFGGGWHWAAFLCPDDVISTYDSSGELTAAGPGNVIFFANTADRTFATIQFYYNGASGAGDTGQTYALDGTCMAVYGTHGLLGYGTLDATHAYGFLASDIIAHAVIKKAPQLRVTTGIDGTITPSSTIIPHLVFFDPTTVSEVVRQASRFGLEEWWVDEGTTGQPTFSWMPRDNHGRRWRARVGPSGLSETGLDASKLYNSVVVVYRDVDGSTKTVGPTGSGATTIDATLADADPENPATKAGLNRPGLLNLGIVSTPARAANAGQAFLAEQKLLNTSGQAVLTGHVEDDHGVLWPAWMVRAGDQISFVDAHSTVNRRIVRSSYNDVQKTCSIDLDAPPQAMDALLQRLGASIQNLGL